MSTLTQQQAATDAEMAGFSGQGLSTILQIAEAESGLRTNALNCNNPGGSCDRGILQINNYWHPEVSDSCANDPVCAFQAGYRISSHGTNFSPWVTFTTGRYKSMPGFNEGVQAQPLAAPAPHPTQPTQASSTGNGLLQYISADNLYRIGFVLIGGILVYIAGKRLLAPETKAVIEHGQ